MFDLITGDARHLPSKPGLPIAISIVMQAAIAGAIVLPLLLVTGQVPEVPTMMAFVAAAPPPPPPPAPPAASAVKKTATEPSPVPTSGAAPIEAPRELVPEPAVDIGEEGVPGGVEGGIPGGVVGGVLAGLTTDIPPPPPPPPSPPAPREPVRIGGVIREPSLLRRVEPVYHPLAQRANIQGTVILEAVVDAEGVVAEVKVLRSAHKLLDEAAIDAVRQWRYSPVVLNGIRERFILTVVLSFRLAPV